MHCYDDWLLLSCCSVQPLVCSHGQVSDIQDSQVAHQIRNSKCQAATVDNTCQAAFECLVFSEHQLHTLCTQQAPRCAADIPEVWYMRLYLVVTKMAIVRCNTAKSNVYTCVKLLWRSAVIRSRSKNEDGPQRAVAFKHHLHATALQSTFIVKCLHSGEQVCTLTGNVEITVSG